MSLKGSTTGGDRWVVLASHDWDGSETIETTLYGAISDLDGGSEDVVLYDYVDTEAVAHALGPDRGGRGASEVRFEYEGYEIKITGDGTISARERDPGRAVPASPA